MRDRPDPSTPLLEQIRIGVEEIGTFSEEEIQAFRSLAGAPHEMRLPEGHRGCELLWATHGPLLVGSGRVVQAPQGRLWVDELLVIPSYRDEGLEQEILYRLAVIQKILFSGATPVDVGAARAPTTLQMIIDAHRHAATE